MFNVGDQVHAVAAQAGDPGTHLLRVVSDEVLTVTHAAGHDDEWVWCRNTSNEDGYVAASYLRMVQQTPDDLMYENFQALRVDEDEGIYDNDPSRVIPTGNSVQTADRDDQSDGSWDEDDEAAATRPFPPSFAAGAASYDAGRQGFASPTHAPSVNHATKQDIKEMLENLVQTQIRESRNAPSTVPSNEESFPSSHPPIPRNGGSYPSPPPPIPRNERSYPSSPPPIPRNEGSYPSPPPPIPRNEGSYPSPPPPATWNEGSYPNNRSQLPDRPAAQQHRQAGVGVAEEAAYWKVAVGSRDQTFGDFEVSSGDMVRLLEEPHQHELLKALVQNVKSGVKGYIPETHIYKATSLDNKPWFVGFETREEAETRLQAEGIRDETFLVRESKTLGGFALSIKTRLPNNSVEIRHRRVAQTGAKYYAWKSFNYTSIEALVKSHQSSEGGYYLKYPYNKYDFPNF